LKAVISGTEGLELTLTPQIVAVDAQGNVLVTINGESSQP
jgi:hypothetical protein